MRGRDEDAPILLVEFDAHDTPVLTGIHRPGLVTWRLALALEVISGGGAAVFEGVTNRPRNPERPCRAVRRWPDNGSEVSLFGIDDGIGSRGIERADDGSSGIVVRELFLFAPQLAGVDQRADGVLIPQQRLGLGTVATKVGTEVLTALG
ncbi:MAG: hypothetical protein WBG92_25720 [Thiohalocapsa sp.]